MVVNSSILMFSITLPHASLIRYVESFTVPIGLMIVAVLLAFFMVVLVLRFQKKLIRQDQQVYSGI